MKSEICRKAKNRTRIGAILRGRKHVHDDIRLGLSLDQQKVVDERPHIRRGQIPLDIGRKQTCRGGIDHCRWFKSATTDVLDKDGAIFGGADTSPGTEGMGEEVDVVEALKKSRMDLTELVERSGIEPARLLDLLQGGGKPTPIERRHLSEVLGVNVTGGYTDVARLALLEIASEPAHRHLWLASNKVDELIAEEATALEAWGTVTPRSARAREYPESLQPFLGQMFTQRVAARSVPNSGRAEYDGGLAEWRAYWRDRLAMSGR